jgi:transcriptional regulator with XRE-family HTH domain
MAKKGPDSIDIEVGRRIRLHRLERRLSQTKLADEIGVTFQQVQKYEKGTNRVGASRLTRIAKVLEVPISAFFGGTSTGGDRPPEKIALELEYLLIPGALRLVQAYKDIQDSPTRRIVLELVEMIASAHKRIGSKSRA